MNDRLQARCLRVEYFLCLVVYSFSLRQSPVPEMGKFEEMLKLDFSDSWEEVEAGLRLRRWLEAMVS